MATFKKKDLHELVGGDFSSGGGDRNVTNNSEIETGPVQKLYNDTSDYEKGVSTTTDKVFGRYRQNIPWFAVYSFGGTRSGGMLKTYENDQKSTIIKKSTVEEKIEDLVKKTKTNDVTEKGYNHKISKLIDSIKDENLSKEQITSLIDELSKKAENLKDNKTKNL